MLTRAIVRPPGPNFAQGLTTAHLGRPDLNAALEQHARYCSTLEECGLTVSHLEPDNRYPDSTFVEDTAVLTPGMAILSNPGAPSRRGEVAAIRETLAAFFPVLRKIEPPGTLDGGDVCEAGDRMIIGISARTNASGAEQLARLIETEGYTPVFVDIRRITGILHLKSAVSFIGDGCLAVTGNVAGRNELREFRMLPVPPGEDYAANCVLINETVLVAAGHPGFEASLQPLWRKIIPLAMTEFRKMDGGLSCLSLRF